MRDDLQGPRSNISLTPELKPPCSQYKWVPIGRTYLLSRATRKTGTVFPYVPKFTNEPYSVTT